MEFGNVVNSIRIERLVQFTDRGAYRYQTCIGLWQGYDPTKEPEHANPESEIMNKRPQ